MASNQNPQKDSVGDSPVSDDKKLLFETVQSMTLMSDILFNSFMNGYVDGMTYVLNTIMGRNDLRVIKLETQHDVPNLYGRSVRFDALVIDQYDHKYDFEVQNANDGASPKRARFNSDMLDLLSLDKGADFKDLPETYVIFITAEDVLGHRLPIYHINRYVEEINQPFQDKSHIIYVNGSCTNDTLLGKLMQDFNQPDPNKIHAKLIADRMKYLKSTDKEVTEMCKLVEEYSKKYAEKKVAEAEKRAKINSLKELIAAHLISFDALQASGKYTADELAAISKI